MKKTSSDIRFGTDGWRAVIADQFTFANLARVAQATASVWTRNRPAGSKPVVVVGFDRRFLSDAFAERTAEIMAGNGLTVILSREPVPTPAVSLAVAKRHAAGGVMITASHNPPRFNGFKIKAHYGGSADETVCRAIEERLDRDPIRAVDLAEGQRAGVIKRTDLRKPYLSAVKKLVDFERIAVSRVRFAHDALFGVGAGCFDALLEGTLCRVTTLNGEHNPGFGGINPEPIAANYGPGARFLRAHPHDICLVTDGDADRVGGMDGRGNPLTTHQLICLLLRHLRHNRGMNGRVVKALTTTSMVDRMCEAWGLELVETGVGFKYVCAEMLKGGVLLGVEESGGIGFPGHIPERDGILAGMMLLEMLAVERKPLTRLLAGLEREFGPHRYARRDIHFPLEKRSRLMRHCRAEPPSKLGSSPVVEVKSFDGVKYVARDGSWLMIRGSGTEPVLRVYAESSTDAAAARLISAGCAVAAKVAGQ